MGELKLCIKCKKVNTTNRSLDTNEVICARCEFTQVNGSNFERKE